MARSSIIDGLGWNRFNRNGKPDDLVLDEKYGHSSYPATVEVKRRSWRITTQDEMKRNTASDPALANSAEFKTAQPQLACVMPDLHVYPASGQSHGFFMKMLACIDTARDITAAFVSHAATGR
jgi:hypothetical protein